MYLGDSHVSEWCLQHFEATWEKPALLHEDKLKHTDAFLRVPERPAYFLVVRLPAGLFDRYP